MSESTGSLGVKIEPELEKSLQEAKRPGFWGCVELDFNDGTLVVIRKTETTKLRSRTGASRDEAYRK